MKSHMSSKHPGLKPSKTPRSPLAASSLSSPVILSPVPMAVVDDASQLLTRLVKRSYRDVAQAAVSQAFPSTPPKSVPQNSVDDSMILSYKTAGWSHVGEQRFDALDEMDPVNFLSHQDYSDFVSAQKFFDEQNNGINAMLSCPDIPSRATVDQMMSHGGSIAHVSGIFAFDYFFIFITGS